MFFKEAKSKYELGLLFSKGNRKLLKYPKPEIKKQTTEYPKSYKKFQ